jgi:flagellar basal-body rod protein FlgG
MIRSLWNTRSGMQAMQDKLDGISNNIANSQTNGYKSVNVNFSDLVYEKLDRSGYPTTNSTSQRLTGSGVKSTEWLRDDTQGPLKPTGQSTDLAVDGEGYFKVTNTDGTTAYTRDGNFNVDSNGDLVGQEGERVEVQFNGSKTPLQAGKFTVNTDGSIVANNQLVGKINLYQPVGQDSMRSIGNSLYAPNTGTQINPVTNSKIRQGFVEASNADLSTEMTDMLVTQRAFELNSKGLTTVDQMMGDINNLRGN